MSRSPLHQVLDAYREYATRAEAAYLAYSVLCDNAPPPRIPGMDTVIRLAVRIKNGRSIEEAAAREYVYRWHLAIKPFDQCEPSAASIFGAPHLVGQ
jgi:hypothetical protein